MDPAFVFDPDAFYVGDAPDDAWMVAFEPPQAVLSAELLAASIDPKLRFCDILKDERDGEYYAYFINVEVLDAHWRRSLFSSVGGRQGEERHALKL